MKITAKITGINYESKLSDKLKKVNFNEFDINEISPSCVINYNDFTFGFSKWVSPKRTRSYPYERIYNTLGKSKKITVIPIIKDEGKRGDRDFIQWDTISLMSLLDVYVIFSYYNKAEKHPKRENKITKQKFDNDLVISKINQIKNYHSSALHWNIKQTNNSFPALIEKVKSTYKNLGEELNVLFHGEKGIDNFANQFMTGVKDFMDTSRKKAEGAQNREFLTTQPNESLSTLTKATITINNYLGGRYYFTTDEIKIQDKDIYLIECKHSTKSILPSTGDIKDGLLKMVLYSNLEEVRVNEITYNPIPFIRLTSTKVNGKLSSKDDDLKFNEFIEKNRLTKNQEKFIDNLFEEARRNRFIVKIENAI